MRIRRSSSSSRRAFALVLFVIFLVPLLSMVGLIIDLGLMMAAHRQAQNAADCAAMAGAVELFKGNTANAVPEASYYVTTQNAATIPAGLPPQIGPRTGPYTGNSNFIEVYASVTVNTTFIQLLGFGETQTVQARAVAGFDTQVGPAPGVVVLDPRANPNSGLEVGGGGQLIVNGSIIDNSEGKGFDGSGNTVALPNAILPWLGSSTSSPYNQNAIRASNNGYIFTKLLQVTGGVGPNAGSVQNIYNYADYNPNAFPPTTRTGTFPLETGAPPAQDPLQSLAVPSVSTLGSATDQNGVITPSNAPKKGGAQTEPPAYSIQNGQTATFSPGVYSDIRIANGATATFNPGIYVLSPTGNNQGFQLTGNSTVTARGAMFYFTGSDYLAVSGDPGHYDRLDDAGVNPSENTNLTYSPFYASVDNHYSLPAKPMGESNNINYATLNDNRTGGTMTMYGLTNGAGADAQYNGILFFFRRRMGPDSLTGNGTVASIGGQPGPNVSLGDATHPAVLYAKWGNITFTGGSTYNGKIVAGSITMSGQSALIINASGGSSSNQAKPVFLVE